MESLFGVSTCSSWRAWESILCSGSAHGIDAVLVFGVAMDLSMATTHGWRGGSAKKIRKARRWVRSRRSL